MSISFKHTHTPYGINIHIYKIDETHVKLDWWTNNL